MGEQPVALEFGRCSASLLLCAGIVWQIMALFELLAPASLKKNVFEKVAIGVILTSAGVFSRHRD